MSPENKSFPKIGVASCCDGEFNRPAVELIIGMLHKVGIDTSTNPTEADAIIVNTCAFLVNGETRTGGILNEIRQNMKPDTRIYAIGCLIAKYGKTKVEELLPDISAPFGNHAEAAIVRKIAKDFNVNIPIDIELSFRDREVTYPREYSYLPISDGCNEKCTYCSLPQYRGKYRSRPLTEIKEELEILTKQKVKEVALAGLETTGYGQDLSDKSSIIDVLKMVHKNPKIKKIILALAHPKGFTDELLETISTMPKLKIIEIPFQHINNRILEAMGRETTKEQIISLLQRIKTLRPDILLTTTFIVGFPGETQEEYNELIDFLNQGFFNGGFGAFAYSPEANTKAATLPNQLSWETKLQRWEYIKERFPINGKSMLNPVDKDTTLKERVHTKILTKLRPDGDLLPGLHKIMRRKDLMLDTMNNVEGVDERMILDQIVNDVNKHPELIGEGAKVIRKNFTSDYIQELTEETNHWLNNESFSSNEREYLVILKKILVN